MMGGLQRKPLPQHMCRMSSCVMFTALVLQATGILLVAAQQVPAISNVALGKTAYAALPAYQPGEAVDGDVETVFNSGKTSNAWISIDLGELSAIYKLLVFAGKDTDAATRVEVRVGGAAVYPEVYGQFPLNDVVVPGGLTLAGGIGSVDFEEPILGRFVFLRSLQPNAILSIAELQVLGHSAVCDILQYNAGYGDDAKALSTSTVPDVAACCESCGKDATCLYWDFQLSTKTCRLKADEGGAVPPGQPLPGFFRDSDRTAGAKRGVSFYNKHQSLVFGADPTARWLWSQPDSLGAMQPRLLTVYFYKSFYVEKAVTGQVFSMADDFAEVYVNGVDTGVNASKASSSATTVKLAAGWNLITIKAFTVRGQAVVVAAILVDGEVLSHTDETWSWVEAPAVPPPPTSPLSPPSVPPSSPSSPPPPSPSPRKAPRPKSPPRTPPKAKSPPPGIKSPPPSSPAVPPPPPPSPSPPPPRPPPPPKASNVALGRLIYASTAQAPPALAVNGIINEDVIYKSAVVDTAPWISIDLGELYYVSAIMYYNNRQCCGEDTAFAEFRLGGAKVKTNWTANQIKLNQLVHKTPGPGRTGENYVVWVRPPVAAQWVTMQGFGDGTKSALQVPEIMVFGSPAVCSSVYYGVQYGGDDSALSSTSEADEGACCEKCYTFAGCLYWDFDLNDRICRLKGLQGVQAVPLADVFLSATRVAGIRRAPSFYVKHPDVSFPPDPTAQWLWSRSDAAVNPPPANVTVYFWKTIYVDEATTGTFSVIGDDVATVFINGVEFAPSSVWDLSKPGAIQLVPVELKAGTNLVLLKCAQKLGGPAMAVATLFAADGSTVLLHTDYTWGFAEY